MLEDYGINARMSVNIFPHVIAQVRLEELDTIPLLTFSTVPADAQALALKRLFDIVTTALLSVLATPALLLTALLVKLTSPGPVLFRQQRCGLNGRTFLKQSPEVVFRKIEEEYILMPLAATADDVDSLYNLNQTGGAIWEKIDGKKTIGEIIDGLQEEYDQDRQTIEQQVFEFVQEIQTAELISPPSPLWQRGNKGDFPPNKNMNQLPYNDFSAKINNLSPGKRIPQAASLELTYRCNNRCLHCFCNLPARDPEARKREFTTTEVKSLLDDLAQMGTLWLLITGGEPLLREDFEEIYLYAKAKGFIVTLFTNGTLLNEPTPASRSSSRASPSRPTCTRSRPWTPSPGAWAAISATIR